MNVIEERYPSLARYYSEWQTIYGSAFERQECHLRNGKKVFPGVDERVIWETEGLLITCWLALQDNIKGVEYKLSGAYRLKKGRIKEELRRFLADMEALLESQYE
jgi:hypothetical protein